MTTQKPPKVSTSKPGGGILRALGDLVMLVLMLSLAGFGGYWFGTQQRLAPVELVGPGTPGARSAAPNTVAAASTTTSTSTTVVKPPQKNPDEPQAEPESNPTPVTHATTSTGHKKPGKLKYWVASTGSDYVGYSIAVSVNGTTADNFFAPGKAVDITKLLKKGDNEVTFNAQDLGDKFNLHKGDEKYALVLNVVSGPTIQENFKPADVILTYKRDAAENENFTDTMHFHKD